MRCRGKGRDCEAELGEGKVSRLSRVGDSTYIGLYLNLLNPEKDNVSLKHYSKLTISLTKSTCRAELVNDKGISLCSRQSDVSCESREFWQPMKALQLGSEVSWDKEEAPQSAVHGSQLQQWTVRPWTADLVTLYCTVNSFLIEVVCPILSILV